jgi:hypothetical protein
MKNAKCKMQNEKCKMKNAKGELPFILHFAFILHFSLPRQFLRLGALARDLNG